jgi:hypothetical protein
MTHILRKKHVMNKVNCVFIFYINVISMTLHKIKSKRHMILYSSEFCQKNLGIRTISYTEKRFSSFFDLIFV